MARRNENKAWRMIRRPRSDATSSPMAAHHENTTPMSAVAPIRADIDLDEPNRPHRSATGRGPAAAGSPHG